MSTTRRDPLHPLAASALLDVDAGSLPDLAGAEAMRRAGLLEWVQGGNLGTYWATVLGRHVCGRYELTDAGATLVAELRAEDDEPLFCEACTICGGPTSEGPCSEPCLAIALEEIHGDYLCERDIEDAQVAS